MQKLRFDSMLTSIYETIRFLWVDCFIYQLTVVFRLDSAFRFDSSQWLAIRFLQIQIKNTFDFHWPDLGKGGRHDEDVATEGLGLGWPLECRELPGHTVRLGRVSSPKFERSHSRQSPLGRPPGCQLEFHAMFTFVKRTDWRGVRSTIIRSGPNSARVPPSSRSTMKISLSRRA